MYINTWYKVPGTMFMVKVCQRSHLWRQLYLDLFSGEPGYGCLQCDNMICFQGKLVPDDYNVTETFKAFVGANTAQQQYGNKHLNSSSKFDFNNGRTMRLFVKTGLGTFKIDIKPKKEKRKIGHNAWQLGS